MCSIDRWSAFNTFIDGRTDVPVESYDSSRLDSSLGTSPRLVALQIQNWGLNLIPRTTRPSLSLKLIRLDCTEPSPVAKGHGIWETKDANIYELYSRRFEVFSFSFFSTSTLPSPSPRIGYLNCDYKLDGQNKNYFFPTLEAEELARASDWIANLFKNALTQPDGRSERRSNIYLKINED